MTFHGRLYNNGWQAESKYPQTTRSDVNRVALHSGTNVYTIYFDTAPSLSTFASRSPTGRGDQHYWNRRESHRISQATTPPDAASTTQPQPFPSLLHECHNPEDRTNGQDQETLGIRPQGSSPPRRCPTRIASPVFIQSNPTRSEESSTQAAHSTIHDKLRRSHVRINQPHRKLHGHCNRPERLHTGHSNTLKLYDPSNGLAVICTSQPYWRFQDPYL